jgi:hypothetical protein
MSSLSKYLESEKKAISREWPSLIMPGIVGLVILWMLIFNSGSTLAASQSMTFEPSIPQGVRWTIPLDLDRLYLAVAYAESGNCGTPWHRKANNCVSIMAWKNGKRYLRPYKSVEASIQAFKSLWRDSYKVFPTMKEAIVWTGNDRSSSWLANVTHFYTIP